MKTLFFSDGSVYHGDTLFGVPHGYGKLHYLGGGSFTLAPSKTTKNMAVENIIGVLATIILANGLMISVQMTIKQFWGVRHT